MYQQAGFTASEMAAATGGSWYNSAVPEGIWQLNTDSRTIKSGECFVPIVGERFDGHDFLDKLPPGVIALAQCGRSLPENLPVLQVQDTLLAYQKLAGFHRQRMKNLKIAAVTGSVGKTSVKEMLRAIFSEAAGADAVLYTIGNTNNQIGVPQNLLRLTNEIRYAVIEMGTNHHGEIAPLSSITIPDAAVINTIAACHLENLGDLEGVAKEKSAVFSAMPAGCSYAVYPAECAGKAIIEHAASPFCNVTFGSNNRGDVSGEYLNGSLNGSQIRLHFHSSGKSVDFNWELTGQFQAVNAAAAAAAASALGIAPEVIARGLSKTTLPGKRMNAVEVNGCIWINDAYNASPQSMKSSLQCIHDNLPEDRELLLVLGDMLELGEDEICYHQEILQLIPELFDNCRYQIFLLGKRFATAGDKLLKPLKNCTYFTELSKLENEIKKCRRSGMIIFLKSSHSTGLCKVEPC